MKIKDVRPIILHMPFVKKDLPMSTRTSRVLAIVQVTTDEGITGYGESFAYFDSAATVAKAIETMIKPKVVGRDPMAIATLWEEMFRAFYYAGRGGITVSAMSGVEIALWDIKGKALNAPVYQLLGGPAHDKIRSYASLMHYASPKEVAKACEKVALKGFTALKLHEIDVASVAAARKAAGDEIDIMLDVNCRWDPVTAVKMGREFEPYNLYWYEEPVFPGDDYDGLADVRAQVSIPLAAGENEYTARGFNGLIENRAVDYLQPSAFKIGGILQEKKVFAMAAASNRRVAPHCWSIGPAMAATVHVCFSEPEAFLVETAIDTPETPIFTKPIPPPEKGFWKLPEGPGLGFEFDEKTLRKYIIK